MSSPEEEDFSCFIGKGKEKDWTVDEIVSMLNDQREIGGWPILEGVLEEMLAEKLKNNC